MCAAIGEMISGGIAFIISALAEEGGHVQVAQ